MRHIITKLKKALETIAMYAPTPPERVKGGRESMLTLIEIIAVETLGEVKELEAELAAPAAA